MADEFATMVRINGEERKIKDENAVTKQEFAETIGNINEILDDINGKEV